MDAAAGGCSARFAATNGPRINKRSQDFEARRRQRVIAQLGFMPGLPARKPLWIAQKPCCSCAGE
jgi:hypothetical protein